MDIGWHGNIQSSFARVIGARGLAAKIEGFYMGLFESSSVNLSPYIRGKGWMVDRGEPKRKQEMLWRGGVELLEFALTANHGSTIDYEKTPDGHVAPVLEKKAAQEMDYERCAMMVQEGILAFAQRFGFLLSAFPLDALQSPVWQEPFFALVEKPTRAQVKLLAHLTHSEAIGENDLRTSLAPKLGVWARLRKGEHYWKHRNASFWKSGFKLRNWRKFWRRSL